MCLVKVAEAGTGYYVEFRFGFFLWQTEHNGREIRAYGVRFGLGEEIVVYYGNYFARASGGSGFACRSSAVVVFSAAGATYKSQALASIIYSLFMIAVVFKD